MQMPEFSDQLQAEIDDALFDACIVLRGLERSLQPELLGQVAISIDDLRAELIKRGHLSDIATGLIISLVRRGLVEQKPFIRVAGTNEYRVMGVHSTPAFWGFLRGAELLEGDWRATPKLPAIAAPAAAVEPVAAMAAVRPEEDTRRSAVNGSDMAQQPDDAFEFLDQPAKREQGGIDAKPTPQQRIEEPESNSIPENWDGTLDALPCAVYGYVIDEVILGPTPAYGNRFPIYNFDCKPVAGSVPSICPNADRKPQVEWLPQIEKRFREMHMIGDGQTIHWVGSQSRAGNVCGCNFAATKSTTSYVPESAGRTSAAAQKLKQGGNVPLRSWTQADLDRAIRSYKSQRASVYNDLVAAIQQGKPGAKKSAQTIYGRNALARALGVKSPAMITKSPEWQAIADELRLPRGKVNSRHTVGKKIGLEIAAEEQAVDAAVPIVDQVVRMETIHLLRKSISNKEADATIERLVRGEITDDQARELIRTGFRPTRRSKISPGAFKPVILLRFRDHHKVVMTIA